MGLVKPPPVPWDIPLFLFNPNNKPNTFRYVCGREWVSVELETSGGWSESCFVAWRGVFCVRVCVSCSMSHIVIAPILGLIDLCASFSSIHLCGGQRPQQQTNITPTMTTIQRSILHLLYIRSQTGQPLVILVVRNFLTAFPASHADKHVAYHQPKGTQALPPQLQPPENNWRQVRDEYLEKSMTTWREMIRYWKKGGTNGTITPGSDYYRVGLILPFEWMMDPLRGPGLVQQLADLYRQVGFDVDLPSSSSSSSSSYIPCLWYQVASKEWHRQEELHSDYIPGYTVAQRDLMVREMEEEWQEEQDDPVLNILLQEYKGQILRETRIEADPTSSSSMR